MLGARIIAGEGYGGSTTLAVLTRIDRILLLSHYTQGFSGEEKQAMQNNVYTEITKDICSDRHFKYLLK